MRSAEVKSVVGQYCWPILFKKEREKSGSAVEAGGNNYCERRSEYFIVMKIFFG